jgi:hypothetical protein
MSRVTQPLHITHKLCEWIQHSYWDGSEGWKLGTSTHTRGLEWTASDVGRDPELERRLNCFVHNCMQHSASVSTYTRTKQHKSKAWNANRNTLQFEIEGRLQQSNHSSRSLYLKPFQSQIIYALLSQIATRSPACWNVKLQQHKYVDFTPSDSFTNCPCIVKQIQQVPQSNRLSFNTTKYDYERVRMPIVDSGKEGAPISLVELIQTNASKTCATLTRKTRIDSFRIPQASTGTRSNNGIEIKLDCRMEWNSEILLPHTRNHPVWANVTGSNAQYRISQRTTLTVDSFEISLTTTTTFTPPRATQEPRNIQVVPNSTTHMLEVELTPNCYSKTYTPEQVKQQCSQCIDVLQSFRSILV